MTRKTRRRYFAPLLAIPLALSGGSADAADAARAKREFITAATFACLMLENAGNSPAHCWVGYRAGKPMLTLTFEDRSKVGQIAPMVLSLVGDPLCAAVKAERNGAAFALADAKSNLVSWYSCEQHAFLGWTEGEVQVSR